MDIIKRIHIQQLKIKHEKKMIPTDLGKKIIRNFKVPKRDHKHNLERYMKTTKRGNKLHKKGDVKYRKVKGYEDFIKNYNLVLKINNDKNNESKNINLTKIKQYKEAVKNCETAFKLIENSLNVNKVKDVQPTLDKDVKELNEHKKFLSELEAMLGVSSVTQLVGKIKKLQNSYSNSKNNINNTNTNSRNINVNSNNNGNDKNTDDNNLGNSDNNQHPRYNFGKV